MKEFCGRGTNFTFRANEVGYIKDVLSDPPQLSLLSITREGLVDLEQDGRLLRGPERGNANLDYVLGYSCSAERLRSCQPGSLLLVHISRTVEMLTWD